MRECVDCGVTFDDRLPGTWCSITGWVVERSAGGANAVRDKQYTGAFVCPPCGKSRDMGLDPNQETMFND